MSWLEALVLLAAVAIAASLVVQTVRLGIGPMPSSRAAREAILRRIPPDTEGPIVELGAGWGGLVVALAKHAPHARVVAWEASAVPFLVTWLRVRALRRRGVEVRYGDFFTTSLAEARYVTCYLFTGAMARLGPKLEAELRPGAHVVSNTFGLRGWQPAAELELGDVFRTRVFDYLR